MMVGYGYQTMWWMIANMVIYSLVGVIVVGALVWIVVWSVTSWRSARRQRALRAGLDDAPAAESYAGLGNSGGSVMYRESAIEQDSSSRSDELMLSH